MLTTDDASVLHVLKENAEQSAVETFTELADLHVAVKQAEPIPSRAKSAFSMGLSRLWQLRSVNWADLTGPLPSRRPITYNLLYVNSLAVEEDSR